MGRLGELLPNLRVHRSDEFGLDVDAKEALAFAVLADRTMHGLPGNLPSVTGARRAVVLGKISRGRRDARGLPPYHGETDRLLCIRSIARNWRLRRDTPGQLSTFRFDD